MAHRSTTLGALLAFASGPLATAAQEAASPTPLFDGRCDEYPGLAQERHRVSEQVELFVFQDEDHVWLCYTLPPESHGTLDMYVDAPGLAHPLNLHVSAQLGEWPADGSGPDGPSSSDWWQVEGWFGNTSRFNGFDGEGSDRRTRFLPSPGREIQMSKARFGPGEWKLQLDVQGVALPGGGQGRIHFPEDTGAGREVMTVQVR